MSAKTRRGPANIEIVPADAPLGAEVRGASLLDTFDPTAMEMIRQAWADYLVLVWRDQGLTVDQHIAVGRRLGTLENMSHVATGSGLPKEILVVENDPTKNKSAAPPADYLRGFQNKYVQWHSDQSYRDVPPMGSLLLMREAPKTGGVTLFSNMYAAYEELDDRLKAKVERRYAIHDPSLNSANVLREGAVPPADVSKGTGPRHPLVRLHPVTERPALYLGRRPFAYIVGYSVYESETLLDELWAHATDPRFVWTRSENRAGDMLLWDNRCTMHARTALDSDARRLAHRVQIAGESPVPK